MMQLQEVPLHVLEHIYTNRKYYKGRSEKSKMWKIRKRCKVLKELRKNYDKDIPTTCIETWGAEWHYQIKTYLNLKRKRKEYEKKVN